MQMNVADAKARLSELIAAAERGEEVIIARAGQPVVRLVPAQARKLRLGALRGKVAADSLPDFDEPLSEEDLAAWSA
jgi:prevent-host-death family protein